MIVNVSCEKLFLSSRLLEKTGAVNSDFLADVIQKFFDCFLKFHHLVGLLLQSSLVVLVRLLQDCTHRINRVILSALHMDIRVNIVCTYFQIVNAI